MEGYIMLVVMIVGAFGIWNIIHTLFKNDNSKKEPRKPSEFENKMASFACEQKEKARIKRKELEQLREKIKCEKEQREKAERQVKDRE